MARRSHVGYGVCVLRAVLSILTAASVTLASPAVASPVDLFGFGSRGHGLAGALGATAEGFEAVYYNPAGLAFDRRPSFALGYQFATFDLRVAAPTPTEFPTRDAPALSIGFGVPIPFGGALKDRLALGLGFVIPQTSILITDIEKPGDPTFPIVENRAQTVSIQAALGLRLSEALALGLGTLALAELDGGIIVEPNAAGRIGSRVKDELIADYALVTGLMLRLLPEGDTHRLQTALTYRSESRADFNLPIDADLGTSFGIPIPQLAVHGTAQYDPAELSLDIAFKPLDFLTISAGLTLERWSTFPLPIAYSAVPEGTPPQPPPDFSDTLSPKLGLELDLALSRELRLRPRLGFAFEPSPTPTQTGFHNHLDSDRAIYALGLGLRWGAFRLDLAGQLHDMASRTHTKSTPEDAPPLTPLAHDGEILFFSAELGVTL
jgi:long-chain fatty acid transport protein